MVIQVIPTSPPLPDAPPTTERPFRRSLAVAIRGCGKVGAHDRIDVLGTIEDPSTGRALSLALAQNVTVLAVDRPFAAAFEELSLQVSSEQAEVLALATRLGRLMCALRNPQDGDQEPPPRRITTMDSLLSGEPAP
jgi:Flp pilus assembly protein CpaB